MTTTVKERPILFSGPMVSAILDGRKTQTRRVMKPQPPEWIHSFGYTRFTPEGHISGRGYWKGVPGEEGPAEKFFRCPYGVPGDRLWVREAFIRHVSIPQLVGYVADGCEVTEQWERKAPSIHMPRRFSRITLEITELRVERLQEITSAGAIAEGCLPYANSLTIDCDTPDPRDDFRDLWDSINASRGFGWDANPWVWCISFRMGEVR